MILLALTGVFLVSPETRVAKGDAVVSGPSGGGRKRRVDRVCVGSLKIRRIVHGDLEVLETRKNMDPYNDQDER